MRDLKFLTAETKRGKVVPGRSVSLLGDDKCLLGVLVLFQLLAQFYQFGCWEMYFHISTEYILSRGFPALEGAEVGQFLMGCGEG